MVFLLDMSSCVVGVVNYGVKMVIVQYVVDWQEVVRLFIQETLKKRNVLTWIDCGPGFLTYVIARDNYVRAVIGNYVIL